MTWNRQTVVRVAVAVAAVLLAALISRLSTGGDAGSPTGSPTSGAPTSGSTYAGTAVDPDSGLPFVALGDLPPEARDTVALIDRGGPFPYDKDGATFGNFEGLLPDHARGYYREYTVITPGSSDRGARRIIGGQSGELFWTADHYASFERISR